MSSKVYVAAIADATASRLLPPARRARLQAELRAALPDLNRRYRRALAARFAVTLGDELQGLLTSPAPAPRPTPPRSCTSTAARSLTWRAAWPGLSWPPAIRCSGPCSRPHDPALRGAPPRLHPRRHALAGAGGRPPPRRDAAPLGSGVRHHRPGGGHVLRSAREAEPRWALVGPG